ncbi:MAG: hypothetical protein RIR61_1100 [Bacteroidota bacterium]
MRGWFLVSCFSLAFGLGAQTVDTAAVRADRAERWDQLSNNQLIRIEWVARTWTWPADSLTGRMLRTPMGMKRDSLLVWLEEGGPVGEVRKRVEAIKQRRYQVATEAFNYTGDIRGLDLSLYWYGIYDVEGMWKLRPVRVKAELSEFPSGSGGLEFDIRTNREQGSHFLFGSPVRLDSADLGLVREGFAVLMPGGQADLGSITARDKMYRGTYVLFATGSVQGVGAECPELRDYQLILGHRMGDRNWAQLDTLATVVDSLSSCPPEVYWSGDLMGDGKPDALLYQKIPGGIRVMLYLSDAVPNEDELWARVAEWRMSY